jgi:hypothetical protein
MHTTTRSIGHPKLTLKQIAPAVSAAFSPNLYRWMKKKAHFYKDGGVLHNVYRVLPDTPAAKSFGEGTLLIGYLDENDFCGVRLMSTLCEGGAASSLCYLGIGPDLAPIEGFWDSYLKIGRCAIDPDHAEGFMDERYATVGATRTCLWCGAKHERVMTPRTVFDESWELLA